MENYDQPTEDEIKDFEESERKYQAYVQARDEAEEEERENRVVFILGSDLMKLQLRPREYAVHELVPRGVTFLVAPPKYGKSWFVLDMCVAVQSGTEFMGRETKQMDVAYFALEDDYYRIAERAMICLDGRTMPDIQFFFSMETLQGNTIAEKLEFYFTMNKTVKFVVIDTFQRVRAMCGTDYSYSKDYIDVGAIKDVADRFGVYLILVHHTRKANDDDPYNTVSGTTGITGATDTVMVMKRATRSATSTKTTLHVTSRAMGEQEIVMERDPVTNRWKEINSATSSTSTSLEEQLPTMIYEIIKNKTGKIHYMEISKELKKLHNIDVDSKTIGKTLKELEITTEPKRGPQGYFVQLNFLPNDVDVDDVAEL